MPFRQSGSSAEGSADITVEDASEEIPSRATQEYTVEILNRFLRAEILFPWRRRRGAARLGASPR